MTSQGQTHLNLIFIPIPPVIVWCLYELLVSRRRNPLRMGALLGALAGAQALIQPGSSPCWGRGPDRPRGCRRPLRERMARTSGACRSLDSPVAAVFVVMTGYMIWSLVFAPGHLVGTIQAVPTLQQYRADLLGQSCRRSINSYFLLPLWRPPLATSRVISRRTRHTSVFPPSFSSPSSA